MGNNILNVSKTVFWKSNDQEPEILCLPLFYFIWKVTLVHFILSLFFIPKNLSLQLIFYFLIFALSKVIMWRSMITVDLCCSLVCKW
jgi:hypothetical protein